MAKNKAILAVLGLGALAFAASRARASAPSAKRDDFVEAAKLAAKDEPKPKPKPAAVRTRGRSAAPSAPSVRAPSAAPSAPSVRAPSAAPSAPSVRETSAAPAGFDPSKAKAMAPGLARHIRSKGQGYARREVVAFQRAAGIAQDGLYGPLTASALQYFGGNAPRPLFKGAKGKSAEYREPGK